MGLQDTAGKKYFELSDSLCTCQPCFVGVVAMPTHCACLSFQT